MLELIRNGRLVEAEALLVSILDRGSADPDTR